MKVLIFIVRVVLGLVFVGSGFLKAMDPYGSCYKIHDYFIAFGWNNLESITLPLAFMLSALEFTIGIMLLFNLKARLGIWLALILELIFTPLTLWLAISNAVSDCGCFGDCIKLSNWETFVKNVVLMVLIVFLLIYRKRIDNPLSDNVELGISGASYILAILFQLYTIHHLPIYDCRPYKVGTYIPDQMVIPDDAPRDEIEHIFIMENTQTGEIKKFALEEYPSDSIWKYKDREDRVIKEGYRPPIHDFTMVPPDDSTGLDYLPILMEYDKPVLLVIMHKLEKADEDGLAMLKDLEEYANRKEFMIGALTSSNADVINSVKDKYQITMQFFNTDDITLKTIVRANPGIVLLQKGTVLGKWNYRDFKF
ncbi:MAG: DoxX family protein [Bacteroidales bacterium]|nr:DoxX family protein [Bacteroidales bacterium]